MKLLPAMISVSEGNTDEQVQDRIETIRLIHNDGVSWFSQHLCPEGKEEIIVEMSRWACLLGIEKGKAIHNLLSDPESVDAVSTLIRTVMYLMTGLLLEDINLD